MLFWSAFGTCQTQTHTRSNIINHQLSRRKLADRTRVIAPFSSHNFVPPFPRPISHRPHEKDDPVRVVRGGRGKTTRSFALPLGAMIDREPRCISRRPAVRGPPLRGTGTQSFLVAGAHLVPSVAMSRAVARVSPVRAGESWSSDERVTSRLAWQPESTAMLPLPLLQLAPPPWILGSAYTVSGRSMRSGSATIGFREYMARLAGVLQEADQGALVLPRATLASSRRPCFPLSSVAFCYVFTSAASASAAAATEGLFESTAAGRAQARLAARAAALQKTMSRRRRSIFQDPALQNRPIRKAPSPSKYLPSEDPAGQFAGRICVARISRSAKMATPSPDQTADVPIS